MRFFNRFIFLVLFFSSFVNFSSQTTTTSALDKGLILGNLLIQGYTAIKGTSVKHTDPNAKTVESFCFKNKMDEKVTVKLSGTIEDKEVKKELVLQKDGKECTYDLPKGVYSYEILLSSKDTYQKGEYKVTEESLMTINHN